MGYRRWQNFFNWR